jgi:protein gp37
VAEGGKRAGDTVGFAGGEMTKTSIEWADEVWNPVTGCNKVSQGCKHCYAETIANRFWATQYPPNEDGSPRKFTDVRVHPERLDDPLKWRKPRRVFVNSMSDLFHEDVPEHFIASVFGAMALCQQHTFMILTKRPKRAADWFQDIGGTTRRSWVLLSAARLINANRIKFPDWPLPNVWLGVSVEDQKTADKRIPMLLQTPAAVRFVSYEPALGPVDFGAFMSPPGSSWSREVALAWDDTSELDWVIMGGESGPGARPMHPDWARSVRDQCQAAGVPFFFKQMVVDGKLAKMPALDGIVWNEYPEATK